MRMFPARCARVSQRSTGHISMCFLIIFQAVRMMSKTCNQLNNIVGHDHRAVKRVTRPMLGFTSFQAARRTLVGIELMHMMKKKPDSPGFSGKISNFNLLLLLALSYNWS